MVEVLKRADPPVCVGLYARWGSGKSFMISLLKKEFDPSVYEDPHTRQLLQFFEEDYGKKNESADDDPTLCVFMLDFLRSIPLAFTSSLPYWVWTFAEIICDYVRDISSKVWKWCSELQRSCKPKAKTAESAESGESGVEYAESAPLCGKGTSSCLKGMQGLYHKVSSMEDQEQVINHNLAREQVEEEKIKRKFIFVDFNAWEYAACPFRVHIGDGKVSLTFCISRLSAQIFRI